MLLAATFYKFSKVHVGRSEEMSPFQDGFVNCETNAGGCSLIAGLRTKPRGRCKLLYDSRRPAYKQA
jgi:hypothetical protein